MTDAAALLPAIWDSALRAGEAIMRVYATDFDVDRKADDSPVTEADLAAEATILETLRVLTPDIPIIAEEEMAAGRVPPNIGNRFWLVDPLDGTREFLARNGEFTVNIALIENARPILGVVHAPAKNLSFSGGPDGAARQDGNGPVQPIAVRRPPPEGLTVAVSRSHRNDAEIERFLAGKTVAGRIISGSSLKFCLVAAGEADLYPRFGPTMEWDTAAGHAVLAAAGGRVTTVEGDEFLYCKKDFANPGFLAWGYGP